MEKHKPLEVRIRDALQPVFTLFREQVLLDKVVGKLVERAAIIDSLDTSYSPMDGLVLGLYDEIESHLTLFRMILLYNPKNLRAFVRSETQEVQRSEIFGKVVDALLRKEAEEYFPRYGLQVQGYTSAPLPSFSSARRIIEAGAVDIGVAVGPGGFVYASLFTLLGLPVRNVHIDASSVTEERPYKELDDVRDISGKRTLVIEDSVGTGRTLRTALDEIQKYSPESVSVYLGISKKDQYLPNVPRGFRAVYTTPNHLTDRQMRGEVDKAGEILERRYSLFKKK